MKKYQYLASWDDQTLTRVGEPVVVLGDSNVSQVEVTLPSNFLLDPTKAECRMYFLLPGEKESDHDVLEAATKDENGDSHVTWTIKHVHSQKGGRLAFSLTLIGDDAQWDSRTAIIPVYESRYQPESEEAEEPYTGRLDALEGSMAAIRGEFAEVQDDFEELKETATLGAPIPKSLASEMVEGGVYLYTGSETGYTAGHVYYYVGGTLTDGGQYGGIAIDDTLTSPTMAAPASEVGQIKEDLEDNVNELSEKIADANAEIYEYVSGASGNVTSGVLNNLNAVDEWVLNAYIDENDGKIKPVVSEGTYASASKNMIVIPDGTEIHVHGASRIAKYDADGTFLGTATVNSVTIINSDDAAYIRIQYGSINTQILDIYVWYYYTATDQAQSIETKIDNACERVQNPNISIASVSGNPLVLTECDERTPFDVLSVSGNVSGENVVVCQKNLFAIRHTNGTFTKNNVKFQFNTINHTIRIFTESGQSASASATSGFTNFGDDFKTVNGSTFYHNFKFRFPVDTRVSVTDNANGEVTFDFGIQMRVYDGTNIINVGTGGVSFTALADTEYIIYFLVQEGWSGDITYAPQVEIGPYSTAYERFNGFKTPLTGAGDENIFKCGGASSARYTAQSGAIKAVFDSAVNAVYLNAHNATSSGAPIYDTSKDGIVNSRAWYYIDKFTVGHVASSLSDLLSNGGKYTIQADDMESGQWSYSTKSANAARARCKSLIPVHAGEKVIYSNTTFDTYFGVLATTSSTSYIQAIGWITDGGGTISINVDGYLVIIIRNHSDTSATVNPADYNSTITIVPESIPVCVRLFNTKYAKLIYGELYDGSTLRTDYTGNGFFLNADVGKEYGVRLGIRDHAAINAVIKPVIATGIYALREYGTYPGMTVVYTDKDASFTVKQHQVSTKTKSELDRSAVNSILSLTGGHIMTPFSTLKKRGGLVSFIDDDTWNMYCVQRYHDIFAEKGVLGGYAVITENMATDPSTMQSADPNLLPTLLEYEKEGFAMLYHCHDQNGANTRYWIKGDPSYDQSLINDNFMSGLRAISTMGFSNYRYWVTPYGVNDKYIQDLAKNHGMQCLFNCPSVYAQEGYVAPYGNVSRWNIPRVIFGNWATNDTWLHRAIQGAKAAKGWVIIVSHVNSWGAAGSESNIALGNRLSSLIQYCLDEGLEIVSAPVAFEEYRAAFYMNELF